MDPVEDPDRSLNGGSRRPGCCRREKIIDTKRLHQSTDGEIENPSETGNLRWLQMQRLEDEFSARATADRDQGIGLRPELTAVGCDVEIRVDPLTGWLWTLDTEREELIGLSRRRPGAVLGRGRVDGFHLPLLRRQQRMLLGFREGWIVDLPIPESGAGEER